MIKQVKSEESDDDMKTMDSWINDKWGYEKLPSGTVVHIPGSSRAFKTGDWASTHPELIKDKCISCLTCFFVCPDTAIKWERDEEKPKGYPVILTDYCKGCGLCAFECDERALLFPGIIETEIPSDSMGISEETCKE
jgi:pyruvate ferredoxin oxidoreductase delta subunit